MTDLVELLARTLPSVSFSPNHRDSARVLLAALEAAGYRVMSEDEIDEMRASSFDEGYMASSED
jgi:hypothetical protein